MSDSQKIELNTRLTREDAAGILEAFVDGLKEGLLKVQKSGEVLELAVPRVVDLEIEAKLSPDKAKFELEVSWLPNRRDVGNVPEELPTASLEPPMPTKKGSKKTQENVSTQKEKTPRSKKQKA